MTVTLGGLVNDLHLHTDLDRIQITIHNLRHHGDALIQCHVGNAIGIGVATLHDAKTVDRALATGLFPLCVAETERAEGARVPVWLLAGLTVFHHQLAIFGAFPERLSASLRRRGGDGVGLINLGHVQTRSRISVELP